MKCKTALIALLGAVVFTAAVMAQTYPDRRMFPYVG